MNLKRYIAPTALAILTIIAGALFLGSSPPASTQSPSEVGALDADVLRYFSAKADQWVKEGAGANSTKPTQKADQI